MTYKRLLFCICVIAKATDLSDFAQSTLLLPPPPKTESQSYIIMDAKTGAVLAEKNVHERMAPASLTKLMTTYVIFHALQEGHLSLDDDIHISGNAWNTEGSRLFLPENGTTSLQTLLKGTIITSGNDASVALSEHFAGSEENFAVIMNRYCQRFNMKDTNFVTATGLDHAEHLSSSYDLAILSSRLINDFPQYFHWFHEKSITYNGITQPNRNTLMNSHPEIDGLKTGYTSKAGYCLATTAQRNNTRLVVVTLNAPTKKHRDQDSLALLNYGFRFYESALLYTENTIITQKPVYLGILNKVNITTHDAFWATLPKGSRDHVKINVVIDEPLQAPLSKHKPVGTLEALIDNEVIQTTPLYPTEDVQSSTNLRFFISYLKLLFKKWF